jgi:hypothetical protein
MAIWDYTKVREQWLDLEGKLRHKNGEIYFQGRPTIHRDSPIDGGVFTTGVEAIVVDSQKYPKLKELYEIAKNKAAEIAIKKIAEGVEWDNDENVLQAVYDTVAEAMPRQSDKLTDWLINKYNVKGDIKIALDVFLETGIGVCRHDALACGALLELFIKDGIIKGKPSMDVNYLDKKRCHAWCRYTNQDDEVYVVDVMEEYLGKLSDAPETGWPYKRPEDQ